MAHVEHSLIKLESVEHREFQASIARNALETGNTLVVAPTGLGKTSIAALVIAGRLQKVRNSKALILAPTKPLCVQHQASFARVFNFKESEIGLLTGTVSKSERDRVWADSRIICATPQTIQSDLLKHKYELGDLSIIVFDEAHKAVKEYAYTKIAEAYKSTPHAFILGLTASPGSSKSKIEEICSNLDITHIEMRSKEDEDVKPYVQETDVQKVEVDLPIEFIELKGLIEKVMMEKVKSLQSMGAMPSGMEIPSKKFLLRLQEKCRRELAQKNPNPVLYSVVSQSASLMKASHALELMETQGIHALNSYFDRMQEQLKDSKAPRALKSLFKDENMLNAIKLARIMEAKGFNHPKIEEVRKLVLDSIKVNEKTKVLIFTQYRDNASSIVKALKEIEGVRVMRFVGQATRGEKDVGLTQKEQGTLLQGFKSGEFNVMVCTSVGEEGLDLPSVDLVVFYEAVPSEIRAIQRKGRTGRHSKGRVVILIAKGTRDEAYYYTGLSKERKMIKTIYNLRQAKEKLPPWKGQAKLTEFI